MSIDDLELAAFADGMLDAEAAARIAAAVAADPVLAARVERTRRATAALRGAFDAVLEEPSQERHLAVLRERPSGQVLAFTPRRLPIWIAAAAACLAVAFLGGRASAPEQMIVAQGGALHAAAGLERALDRQPSGRTGGRIEIALTAPAADGYCRVFRADATAGVACGERGEWTIVALAAEEAEAGAGAADYRQARGALPSAILAAAGERQTGDALDAAAEAEALRAGWRSAPNAAR